VERNRLDDLRGDAEAARERAELLRARAEAAQVALREASARESATRAAGQAARRALEAARTEHASAERRRNESGARLAALDAAEAATLATREEAARKHEEIADAIADLAPADDLGDALEAARQTAARHRAAETEARAALHALAREREAKDKRRATIAGERRSWLARRDQAGAHRDEIGERMELAIAERDDLADAPNRFILARRSILSGVEKAEADLRAASDARQAAETALADADREARAALEAMSTARDDKARGETRVEVARLRLDTVIKTAATDLDCEAASLPALAGVAPGDERPAAAAIAARLDSLRQDRDRLGAVNLRADEELAEIETRRSALDKERRSTHTSRTCLQPCSGAERRSFSSSNPTIRSRRGSKSWRARRERSRR
jgi:chromosome segregation protein